MAENGKHKRILTKFKFEPQYFIVFFSLVILITFVIVFVRPVYPASLQTTTGPSIAAIVNPQSTSDNGVAPTPTNLPPTPEEIGYTDGIILWATILVVILLVGTLRETLRRKGK